MKVWGYVLIGLNLIAAGAFTFLALSVWKARTEWQYAYFKQELAIIGMPLDPSVRPPEDVSEGSVPFEFQTPDLTFTELTKAQLVKLIPQGGPVLGTKGGEAIANQTDEVKRVQAIVFDDLNKIGKPDDKRLRVMILLLNLATGMEREGVFALMRDYPHYFALLKQLSEVPEREKQTFEWKVRRTEREEQLSLAQRQLAFLGKTGQQQSVLQGLNAVEKANKAYAPNVSPEDKKRYLKNWREAVIAWARGQVWYAVPPPAPKAGVPAETLDRKDQDRLNEVLAALEPLMLSDAPDAAEVDKAKQRLLALLEGEGAIQRESAKIMVPFIADIGANLLDSEEKVAEAKKKLVNLLTLGASSEAEKKSLAAIADLIVPPKSEAGANEIQRVDSLIETAAAEMLRSFFEEAAAKPSTDLPDDVAQARSKLAALKPIRDADAKRRAIAHLLYHLDAHVSAVGESRAAWYNLFVLGDAKAGTGADSFHFNAVDEELRKNRVAWHQRVVAVVGLESYVAAVEAQATQFREMAEQLRSRIGDEQGPFLTEYQYIVNHAMHLAGQLEIGQDDVRAKQLLREQYAKQLDIREGEKEKLGQKLQTVTANTKNALANLDAKVAELFQITKQLGEAQDSLMLLELRLRNRE
jgi:hypothetical protein